MSELPPLRAFPEVVIFVIVRCPVPAPVCPVSSILTVTVCCVQGVACVLSSLCVFLSARA